MARLIIKGGKRLNGEYVPSGNKNAALPMLAACVLTDEPVCLKNLPLIQDVRTMLEILADVGVDVALQGHKVTLQAREIRRKRLNSALCRQVRSSILFAGPMAARHGEVRLVSPGGDVIGRRRLDTHFDGLRELGIRIQGGNEYVVRRNKFRGARILLDEASVTATENVVMAAVLARGVTSVFNAACEPHVQDLCAMLNRMGAQIDGIGTNLLTIRGVDSLHGVTESIRPDHVEIASFIAAAAVTHGTMNIPGVPAEHFAVVARVFDRLGIRWDMRGGGLRLPVFRPIRIRNDHRSAIPKIEDGTWPGFPSDLMSVAIVLATQAEGTVLFFEKMFESRMYFVDRLIDMGARIVQCDPHRVIVTGPARLRGTHLSSPDIRAGMALLIAALCAEGTSVIDNAQIIDRGYESVERKLRKLGADVTRVEG